MKRIVPLNKDRTTVATKKRRQRKDQAEDQKYMLKADSPAFSAKTEF